MLPLPVFLPCRGQGRPPWIFFHSAPKTLFLVKGPGSFSLFVCQDRTSFSSARPHFFNRAGANPASGPSFCAIWRILLLSRWVTSRAANPSDGTAPSRICLENLFFPCSSTPVDSGNHSKVLVSPLNERCYTLLWISAVFVPYLAFSFTVAPLHAMSKSCRKIVGLFFLREPIPMPAFVLDCGVGPWRYPPRTTNFP